MLMTMDPDIKKNLEHLGAYDMLKELNTLYVQQADQELFQTLREFHACKQEVGQSVSSYVLEMKSYIDNLERLGHAMTQNLSVSLILVSLKKEYDGFVQNYNMHSMEKIVNELHAMLKLHEQTLPPKEDAKGNQGKGKAKMGYAHVQAPPFAPKPKNPPTPKKDNPSKDVICHQCGDMGFRRSNKLKPRALILYMSNGHRVAVEAIGDFHLCLPSGLVLILDNYHYDPSITRRIISVSHLYKDGFVIRFENDNSIFVFKNNMIYFNVILRYDTYKIVMSSSNTNECSMYVVTNKKAKFNLDSALLWHCHLGHIHKKHIEKLQHDGLLDSTNIKSLEKCVACMSGKMARKPYSHQVERAKDLLGLIHTDVCGPFKIMSRQGAYYFVTFTDDFSHTSLNHEEDDQEIDEPQSDINPIRRSTRTCHPTYRLCLYVDAEEHGLGDLGEPANYKVALLDPEFDKWLNVMNTDMDGAVHTYKALLVSNGFTQTLGINYEETFSHVADIRAIRILIAIAAFYDYEIWQMDVKTVILNRYLNEEVYMEQPEDAKYITAFDASKEAVGIHTFIYGLGVVPTTEEPINIYCDNTGAIAIAKDHGVTKGARHFRVKVHYLRETTEMGDVKIEKVDTYDNLADPFAKALAFPKHSKLTKKIGMIPASSLIIDHFERVRGALRDSHRLATGRLFNGSPCDRIDIIIEDLDLEPMIDAMMSGSEHEDPNEHIKKVLEISDLFHILKNKFLRKYYPPARTAKTMKEINNFPQEPDETLYNARERFKELLLKCPQYYSTDMYKVIAFYKVLDAPTRQILKSRGCEICKGPHYTKDFPNKEDGKTLKEAYYTQFGVPFPQGQFKAAALGYYQRNNGNLSYQERKQSLEDPISNCWIEEEEYEELHNMHVYSYESLILKDNLPGKGKDLGSFILPCFINNMSFNKALTNLGASVSVMSFLTYTTLRVEDLVPTQLIVELADKTVKHPKGIAENVLVVLEDMDVYRDKEMSDVIVGKESYKEIRVKSKRLKE
uniref:Zinc finger, CCHC-type n=1 Tax=Tanacetum cinerariifolium TaxID=118510 RepID=A0A6L2LMC0_TANCI|nr:hypothetical protein [Tanacetum cinerariifolium]